MSAESQWSELTATVNSNGWLINDYQLTSELCSGDIGKVSANPVTEGWVSLLAMWSESARWVMSNGQVTGEQWVSLLCGQWKAGVSSVTCRWLLSERWRETGESWGVSDKPRDEWQNKWLVAVALRHAVREFHTAEGEWCCVETSHRVRHLWGPIPRADSDNEGMKNYGENSRQ